MIIVLALCAMITADPSPVTIPVFPDDVAFLNEVPADNPDRVVDAVRQFALLQFALFDWDREIVSQLQGDPASVEELKARQKSAMERLTKVEHAYKVLLDRYPKNARALNYYGEFLVDYRNDELNGVRCWREAIANDPKLALPYNNLAIYYAHTGQYAFGIENYDKAIELDPENPDFKYNKAQLYLACSPDVAKILKCDQAKVYKEGMKLSRAAADLKPNDFKLQQDYASNFYASDRFQITPDWADAAAAWKRAREVAQDNDEIFFAWLNEARAWVRKPDKAKAEACLIEALKLKPTSAAAQHLLEKVRSGDLDAAKADAK